MRKPETIERLYMDFDGFFASVEQQADRRLRGQPVGVVPFGGTDRTCVIAVSREAKVLGVKNVMTIKEAKNVCPDMIFVPQKPDLYRRAHNALVTEIETVLPIDTIKSIDELICRLDNTAIQDPCGCSDKIKTRIRNYLGESITVSIGFAANRQLAKMACKAGKKQGRAYGNGFMVWYPQNMPLPLFKLELSDIPGVGSHMHKRLLQARIQTVEDLYNVEPKHMRKLWHNVTGERLWYALHGYAVEGTPSGVTRMVGHGRVLPPESRTLQSARDIAWLLATKAARRLRRARLYTCGLSLWFSLKNDFWNHVVKLSFVNDDHAILAALNEGWRHAQSNLQSCRIFQVGVALIDLSSAHERQADLFLDDDVERKKWETVASTIDYLNGKYGCTLISQGLWKPPSGGHAGGKISFTRVPEQEDFW